MRVSLVALSVLTVVFLAGCGPQERSPEFYAQPENAAEFAEAIEICKKSGLSQQNMCKAVWQAKAQADAAEDRALREKALSEMGGTTVVPQSPRQAPASQAASPRKAPSSATATADPNNPTANN